MKDEETILIQEATEKTDERLIEIETKLAYQEDLLQSLNQIVIEQNQRIEVLQIKLSKLTEQTQTGDSNTGAGNAAEEAPPHY